MVLPPPAPPLPPRRKGCSHYIRPHITHAVFSSLYAYVRDLHLWHTKTEKQIQDKLMVT